MDIILIKAFLSGWFDPQEKRLDYMAAYDCMTSIILLCLPNHLDSIGVVNIVSGLFNNTLIIISSS